LDQSLNFFRIFKNDATIISALIPVTLIVLIVSLNYNKAMFFFDPYTFFSQALNVSKGTSWTYNPFILFVSLLIKIYPYSDGLLLFVRILSLIFATQLVVFIYLIARKMFSQFYSVVTASIALFLPLVHAYSLQLHNDVFTAAMGFTAIYFLTKRRLKDVILGFFFILIACATRGDFSIIFALPVGLIIASYYTRGMLFRSKMIASLMVVAIVLGVGYIIFQDYYRSTTRFGILDRISIFSEYDLMVTVWRNLIAVTNNEILNTAYAVISLAGIILLISANYKKFMQMIKLKDFEPTESEVTAIFLAICFFVSLFSVGVFHTEYSIIDGKIFINYNIGLRYLIPVQLFFAFGFVYAISTHTLKNILTVTNLILQISRPKYLSPRE
jgi:hypothetical protein